MVQVYRPISSSELMLTRAVVSSWPLYSSRYCGCVTLLAELGNVSQPRDAVTAGTTWNRVDGACQVYDIIQPNNALRPPGSTSSIEHFDERSIQKSKGVCKLFMEIHLTTTEYHLPYGITQCYPPPDTREHTPPSPQPDRLVLDLPTI